MRESLEFLCPECESRQFVIVGVGAQEIGRCRSCGHQWYRDQDYVYFVLVQRFTSPREFDRYRNGRDRLERWFVRVLLVVLWLASVFGALRFDP